MWVARAAACVDWDGVSVREMEAGLWCSAGPRGTESNSRRECPAAQVEGQVGQATVITGMLRSTVEVGGNRLGVTEGEKSVTRQVSHHAIISLDQSAGISVGF